MAIKISLLLMTHNRRGAVARCFRSLLPAIERPDVETLILDNASTDGTQDYIYTMVQWWKRDNPRITLWRSAANLGVAGGRNFLMGHARGDIFVILDSDVVAESNDWLDILIEPLSNREIGITGPGGHWITLDNKGRWKWFAPAPQGYVGEADVVSGYCQAFRREIWDGGIRLDEFYNPYWHEDSSMCLEIAAQGLRVWCNSTLPLLHIFAGSGDDGKGHDKFRHLEQSWSGLGLIRAEREKEKSG